MAPLTMWDEKNTGSNLPAQIELYATDGGAYKFLFMAKGGGSANKSFLYQETKAVLNEASMMKFLEEKIRSLGTAACPPYHLAIVVGGTSAEYALKTAKYASAHYLDEIPAEGSELGHGFRDKELEEKVFELTQKIGIGAQFGGKYFCHDVRVVRLPRHGASCPVAIAVSCSADRQALAKITADGVFLEELETDPARYLPDVAADDLTGHVVLLGGIAYNRVTKRLLRLLEKLPVRQMEVAEVQTGEIFAVGHGAVEQRFLPVWSQTNGGSGTELEEDVGLLARVRNPFNSSKTLTLCNGIHSRGVLGSVRTLTDARFREANEAYLAQHFPNDEYGLLVRVPVFEGETLTPDLQDPDNILYAWPQNAATKSRRERP